jgi:hypothetical protein
LPLLPFPPEFRLVAACCRWPASAARDAAVREAAAAGIDWETFLKVVRRHRVEGLVHEALKPLGDAAPQAVRKVLGAQAATIVRENLAFAAEARRLTAAFDAAGFSYFFIKGVALNMLAYGTLGVKRASDLDVVIDPADYPAAVRKFMADRAVCQYPHEGATFGQVMRWTEGNKHSIWFHFGVRVELHVALVDNPRMLPGVSVRSGRQMVPLGAGISVPTLAREELFTYLCVHGATHAWSRLKWLADVAAFVAGEDAAGLEQLYRAADALGGGRSAGSALLLSQELLGLALPALLEAELRRSRPIAFLNKVARDAMVRGGPTAELDETVLGTAGVHLSHLRMVAGAGYKWSEIRRKIGSLRRETDGPVWVRAVAPVWAGPRWLWRRIRRASTGA